MKPPKINDKYIFEFSFSEDQVLLYSEISGDINPIHIDKEYASNTQFKRCIVHGYFTTSIFSKIYGTSIYPDGHILISQSSKHISPIYTDVIYNAIFTVKELFPDKNRVLYSNDIYEKESGEIKLVGESVLMNKKYYNW